MSKVGLTACPGDAMKQVVTQVNYVCANKGGNGALREFAELIIELRT